MTPLRVALRYIDGPFWQGGYNYLLNLCRVIKAHKSEELEVVLFATDQATESDLQPFHEVLNDRVVVDPAFTPAALRQRQLLALASGADRVASRIFQQHGIDVVFENADFYGWRFPVGVLAWMPDFQHRMLPHMFSKTRYYRRELGFRLQIGSGRQIMVSSQDAKTNLQRLYGVATERINVVPFALPMPRQYQTHEVEAVRCRFKLPEKFFICPNQFVRHKNHINLARAVAEMANSDDPVTVVCPGSTGSQVAETVFNEVQEYVTQNKLGSFFRLVGRVSSDDLNCLIAASQALINPSMYEGWSTTVEEAKSIGLPMLLADLRVNREQTDDSAIYFDANNPSAIASTIRQFSRSKSTPRPGQAELERVANARQAEFADGFNVAVKAAVKRDR